MGFDPKDVVVVSPDEGSIKRALGHAERLGGTLAIVDKRRADAENTRQENIIGGAVEGKIALMFDDMISTAGSICGAAKVLHERGAEEIYVAATHGVLCGPAIERLQGAPICEVVVTDTIPLRPEQMIPKIKVLSVAPLLGRGDQANPPQRIGQPAVRLSRPPSGSSRLIGRFGESKCRPAPGLERSRISATMTRLPVCPSPSDGPRGGRIACDGPAALSDPMSISRGTKPRCITDTRSQIEVESMAEVLNVKATRKPSGKRDARRLRRGGPRAGGPLWSRRGNRQPGGRGRRDWPRWCGTAAGWSS